MMNLKLPTNQVSEILYLLLEYDTITFGDSYLMTGITNLNARISDIRRLGLDVPCKMIKFINKFGRKKEYGTWSLPNKKLGIEVYKKLLKL